MKLRFLILAASGALVAACSSTKTSTSATDTHAGPDLGTDFGTLNGMEVEVTAEGGFAALLSHQSVRHDDRFFATSQRHICMINCGAPLDTASGTLSRTASDSLFNVIVEQLRTGLSDDYGVTKTGADMMTYTVRVTSEGGSKTVRADSGTMPPAMRRILEAVQGIIAAARG